MDHFSRIHRSVALLSVVTATTLALAAPASAQETFKLGIVTFLSGPAADSFGVPARADLEQAMQLFDQHGVTHGEITRLPSFGIDVLSFQDPDGIQLELTAPVPADS